MLDNLLTINWDEINDLLTQSEFEELDAPKTASANFSKSKNGMYKHDAFVLVTTSDYTKTHPPFTTPYPISSLFLPYGTDIKTDVQTMILLLHKIIKVQQSVIEKQYQNGKLP